MRGKTSILLVSCYEGILVSTIEIFRSSAECYIHNSYVASIEFVFSERRKMFDYQVQNLSLEKFHKAEE